jgi:hypothetical protein
MKLILSYLIITRENKFKSISISAFYYAWGISTWGFSVAFFLALNARVASLRISRSRSGFASHQRFVASLQVSLCVS